MKRLTECETKVMDEFHITPNALSLGEWDEGYSYPDFRKVSEFCSGHGMGDGDTPSKAKDLVESLGRKLLFEEDSFSEDDTAAFILSRRFTRDELLAMDPSRIEGFMKDWKYFFGYRKCDGNGMAYKVRAIELLDGRIVEDTSTDELCYKEL